MRGAAHVIASVASAIAVALVASQGCQDPTQVTLDISLTVRAQCAEVPHGTAITVAVEPMDVEDRVSSGFVNAKTTDCDPVTRHIGTLVVTPTDPERASVVVVSGYRRDPAECKPPSYEGCIVARRRWSFAKRRPLRMPITIDPKCADVPCDAFSTCRDGLCFSSEIDTNTCTGDGCDEPGASADGGTNPDAAVEPEGGPNDAGSNDAPADGPPIDGGLDGGDGGGVFPPYCAAGTNTMHCWSPTGGDVACNGVMQTCCDTPTLAFACNPEGSCSGPRHCCVDSDCAPYQFCSNHPSSAPGICINKTDGGDDAGGDAGGGQPPYCNPSLPDDQALICYASGVATSCMPPADCCDSNSAATCPPVGACIGARYCCTNKNCGEDGGWTCGRSRTDIQTGKAGRCFGQAPGGGGG